MKNLLFISFLIASQILIGAEKEKDNYKILKDIPYISENTSVQDDYRKERCKLDVYFPADQNGFPTVVYFHGGGLEGGNKYLPEELKDKGIAVVTPNYRLSPKAQHPAYIEDAAEAVKWTMENINQLGGDSTKVYISGHSAGGYLSLMLALDTTYLTKKGYHPDEMAGYAPLSGQTNTHYTIRKERGLDARIPVIDSFAPIFHSRKMKTQMILVTGDRKKELLARYTENAHLLDILREFGNQDINLYELEGFDHGTMVSPGCYLLVEMIRKNEKN
ncbi:MAG: alpha/beta hydrolase [Bacteroidales bacterium]